MVSTETTTKGSNLYNRSDTSLSSNYDKQIPMEDETNTSKSVKSSDSNFRHRSQKFMKKVRRFSLNSLSTHSKNSTNEQNGSGMSSSAPLNIPTALNSDLKSILKNPKQNRSNSYPPTVLHNILKNFQHSVSSPITADSVNNKENNTDFSSSYTLSDSSLKIKHVRFNDKISSRNYEPDDPVTSIQRLSLDEHNDLLNELSINTNTDEENFTKPLTSSESTEDRFEDVIDNTCL